MDNDSMKKVSPYNEFINRCIITGPRNFRYIGTSLYGQTKNILTDVRYIRDTTDFELILHTRNTLQRNCHLFLRLFNHNNYPYG